MMTKDSDSHEIPADTSVTMGLSAPAALTLSTLIAPLAYVNYVKMASILTQLVKSVETEMEAVAAGVHISHFDLNVRIHNILTLQL